MIALALSGALALAEPAVAPGVAAPVAAAAVDPARLQAARALIERIMPPGQRQALMDALVKPIAANMQTLIAADPQIARLGKDPRVAAIVARFMQRVLSGATADMAPLFDAMAVAYARQFDVAQLDEARAFYASPTGRLFIAKAPAIAADPDVMQAQRALMAAQMARMPDIAAELKADLARLRSETPSPGK